MGVVWVAGGPTIGVSLEFRSTGSVAPTNGSTFGTESFDHTHTSKTRRRFHCYFVDELFSKNISICMHRLGCCLSQ